MLKGYKMKTNNRIPAYRFQGYTDAWEERKLGEVVYISSGYTGDASLNNGKYKLTRIETISDGKVDVSRTGFSNELPDEKYRLKFGDILFSNINSLAHIGKVAIFNIEEEVFHGINLLRLVPKQDLINPYFIYYQLVTESKKNWSKAHANQAVNQASINQTSLSIQKISLPFLPEQEAIGTFFSTLDRHITLHQRKLDTLKEQKKTYLKLLFPAKGQTKPALRFQGFEDDWEEVKLGEVLVEYNKKSEIENQFELLSSTNSGIEPRSGRVSGESNIGYKIIKRGMVVLSPQNLWLGNINYNAKFEIGIVSPSYKVFNIYGPNELFLATVLRLPQMFFEYAQASVQGASIVRRNLDLDLFGSILVPLPTLPEQEAIGTFFSTLDQEIAQVEDKLASLKEMKKTLLRKLFV